MTRFSQIKSWLNQPYPGPESYLTELRGLAIAGLIIFLVLFLFKPFGLTNYNGSILLLTIGFGIVTFLIGASYNALVYLILKIRKDVESWTIKNWIIDNIFLILFIGTGNFLFIIGLMQVSFSWKGLGFMLLNTFIVAIIPLLFFGFRRQLTLERQHHREASLFSEKKEAKNSSENNLLAVEAMQNYIHIFSTENGEFRKTTERKTLSLFLSEAADPSILQCHRSYLINTKAVKKVTGNSQGLKLEMTHQQCPIIPVSRSFIKKIKPTLTTHNETN